MNKEIELLHDTLLNKNPILVLGAGFSKGIKNRKGKLLPNSKELAVELFNEILIKNLKSEELDGLPINEESKLKDVCDVIDTFDLKGKRDKYLIERFSGCNCCPDDYHMLLKKYQWSTIFTLNIDDLVENIYENQISVQNYKKTKQASYPILSKLHGSVNEPLNGFVFSSEEYRNNIIFDNWCNLSFGVDYCRNDVIFLGTEFQEEDIIALLEKFEAMIEFTKTCKYYFVSPQLNNWQLKKKIDKNENYYHINWTTEEFLKYVNSEICIANSMRKKMRNFGVVFVDEENRETASNYLNVGSLYLGDYPRVRDILDDWDIRYPNYTRWFNGISKANHQLLCLYGESYVGKSCIALRFMVDFFKAGYLAIVFSIRSDLDQYKYQNILLDYLNSLPEGSKIVVLAENMAIYYDAFISIIQKCPNKISQLILIVTSNVNDHRSKQYLLEGLDFVLQYAITYKLNYQYAENIYYKLNEKNHLNKLSLYCDKKQSFINYILSINDIIEVLYVAQEGRKFNDYFSSWLDAHTNSQNKKIFNILYFLQELGINNIQVYYFYQILSNLGIKILYEEFLKEYKDLVKVINNEIEIRCFRIIKRIFKDQLTNDEKQKLIYIIAKNLSNFISDREESPQSEMYQKVIKVKRLIDLGVLSKKKILETLIQLEKCSAHLSYYWIQRGIANRNLDNFEEANNSFEKAISVRGHSSYHIQHAQAKNYMAWGIWAVKNKKNDQVEYFNKGKELLYDLINNSSARYFGYSIHTYTDMLLNFYKLKNEIPDIKEVRFIESGLNQFINEEDWCCRPIIKKFKDYCTANGIKINIADVKLVEENTGFDIDDI